MNIKKKIPRLMSVLLSFAMAFGNVLPVYATEAIISESSLEETEQLDAMAVDEIDGEAVDDGIEAQADIESRYETVEVGYSQSSRFFVTIPKTVVLGTDKKSPYSIKVEGDIVANKQVCVVPVDGITDTEVFDFYMKDQITGSTKEDVVAEVSQAKFYWDYEEAAAGYEENDNYIIADGLSAGRWKGTFQLEISMRTDPTHIHNYVGEVTKEPTCTESGEKTYICDCGDSYTETIDPTGHHYEHGECTDCGEKDPDHEHHYTEVVTKQPTCTEDGERTYTCDCGDSYTETIPATGHHYVDGGCEHCGEKDPDAHEHSYTEKITKEPTCTEDGEKTYTCECGDSYTETIPATGHHYVDGECEHCGEKDPDAHTHNYIEKITKEPTCTEDGEKTYTCDCGDNYTEVIPATGHHFGDNDKCTDCGEFNPEHKHDYTEEITKEPTCTEDGEKTCTCDCGDSYTEVIPATGHDYVDGKCEHCGEKNDPHAANRIKIGTTETRVIAGQELEFICIDDAYVDATGKEKGALFIAKDFISGNTLSMGVQYSYQSIGAWSTHNVRKTLNGETSDLSDLVYVDTTINQKYLSNKTTKNYDMETIDSYGTASTYNTTETSDQVFILSLEEAVKYNKVMIDGKEISVMWDLDCDGEIDMNSGGTGRSGYYLRTPASEGFYAISYNGSVCGNKYNSYGIRPCYVKPSGYHEDEDGDDICDLCGHKHEYEENIDDIVWENIKSERATQSGNDWKIAYGTAAKYAYVDLSIKVPKEMDYTINYSFIYGSYSDWFSLTLDGSEIMKTSSYGSDQCTITLSEGTHTIRGYIYKGGTSSTGYVNMTFNPINVYNHKCNECGIKEDHIYEEKIIKEPTCTEKGEKELICTKCGYSYTEEVPVDGGQHIDENGDDVCDKCGHVHIWEENTDIISWVKNFNSSSIVKTGDQWKLYYDTSNQYTKYTLDGYWDITVPEDVEYSFDYRLSDWGSDSLAIYLDDTEIVNVSESSSESKTVTLTKGTHTIHAHFNKKSEWTSPYAMITLKPIEMLNHICTECDEKEVHHYAEGIVIKEPTCTEKGEKEFTCTKCNGTKIEEIEALGHNYVEGVCDRCGSLNLIKERFWSASASTSTTADNGGGHYDKTDLVGAYSPNIEITEDMRDGEYLLLDFYVGYPFYGGTGHYGEVDGINGLSMLQKYDEGTDTWQTIYSYGLSYSTVGTTMNSQEGGYGSSSGNGIMKAFQLEKGTYRAYGRFTASSGCASSVAHHYYSYRISVDLCQVDKGEVVETP